MESLGATIIRFELSDYDTLSSEVNTGPFEARTVMERYFSTLGSDAPVKNFAQLVAAKTSAAQKTLEAELAVVDGINSQTYKLLAYAYAFEQATALRKPPASTPGLPGEK